MKRTRLLGIYTALWVYGACLLLLARPHVHGVVAALLLFVPPVFALYFLSTFLFENRQDTVRWQDLREHASKRLIGNILFLFALVVLTILIF
ncbi:MAG TPA: hypothetical protein PK836_07680 [Syntrophales bacterium]|nr:hypothetical protein [Syntrophales bacterium]HOM07976.1 hypothetical protein [Syntrophales bacterium]HOO00602.1 hypothetical protein [Syntrophales bacterium]HPC01547.1 hypothetical protein [Syntrophales bacterium]HPQ06654.1 hypothetical protein [Syntrophales bacterium]